MIEFKIPFGRKIRMMKSKEQIKRDQEIRDMKFHNLRGKVMEMNENFEQLKMKLSYQHNLSKHGYETVNFIEDIPEFTC